MNGKICFVLPKYALEELGGAELQVYYLAKELVKKDYTVHYIREKPRKKFFKKNDEAFYLHSIPRIKYFFLQLLNLPFLFFEMKRIRADFWYSRVSKSYLIAVVLISRIIGGKVIWACSHDREVSKFVPLTNSLIKKTFERIEHYLFIWALKKTDTRLVQTAIQQDLLTKNLRLDSYILENSHPIPALKQSERENKIVWVANMRDFKRPHLFLELAKCLQPSGIQCIMIGAAYKQSLINDISSVESTCNNFKYYGPQSVNEVYAVLQTSKILVNTSLEEGFPNTFIQAWLMGVPVVTLGVDPSNIIKQFGIGIITESVSEMADSVQKLLNDEQKWQDLSLKSRNFAQKRFNIDTYTSIFITQAIQNNN